MEFSDLYSSPFILIAILMSVSFLLPHKKVSSFSLIKVVQKNILNLPVLPKSYLATFKMCLIIFLLILSYIDVRYLNVLNNLDKDISWAPLLLTSISFNSLSLCYKADKDSLLLYSSQKKVLYLSSLIFLFLLIHLLTPVEFPINLIIYASSISVVITMLILSIRFRNEIYNFVAW